MTKIQFEINSDNVLDTAQNLIDKGEIEDALSVLRKSDDNVDVMLKIAEILSELDMFSQSNDVLYKVLSIDPNNEDAMTLLGQNGFAKGNWGNVMYYLKEDSLDVALEYMDDDDEEDEDDEDISKYRIVYPKGHDYVLQGLEYANEEFTKGNFDKAYEQFSELYKVSPKNLELLNNLAFVCIMKDNYEDAEKYVNEALQIEPKSLPTLSNAVLLYHLLENKEMRDKYSQVIDTIDTQNHIEIFKVAAAFCECKDHLRANKWLAKYLEIKNHQEIELLYAISAYNSKNFNQAKEILLDLMAIEPNNSTVNFYLDYINDHKDEDFAELEYTPQLPNSEIEKRILHLQSSSDFFGMWTNKALYDEIVWALSCVSGTDFAMQILEKVADSQNNEKIIEFFKGMLICGRYDCKLKAFALNSIIHFGVRGEISLVYDGKFYQINVPANLPSMVKESVVLAISSLAFLVILDEDDLNNLISCAQNLQTDLIDLGLLSNVDDKVVAGLIVRDAQIDGIDDKDICETFKIDYQEIANLTEIIKSKKD